MKFRNIRSGNVLNVKDEATIALMTGSSNYEVVKEKKAGKGGKEGEGENGTTPPAE